MWQVLLLALSVATGGLGMNDDTYYGCTLEADKCPAIGENVTIYCNCTNPPPGYALYSSGYTRYTSRKRLYISSVSKEDYVTYTCVTKENWKEQELYKLTLKQRPNVSLVISQNNVFIDDNVTLTANVENPGNIAEMRIYFVAPNSTEIPAGSNNQLVLIRVKEGQVTGSWRAIARSQDCGDVSSAPQALTIRKGPCTLGADKCPAIGENVTIRCKCINPPVGYSLYSWGYVKFRSGKKLYIDSVATEDYVNYTCTLKENGRPVERYHFTLKERPELSLVISPNDVMIGDSVTLTANVGNPGDIADMRIYFVAPNGTEIPADSNNQLVLMIASHEEQAGSWRVMSRSPDCGDVFSQPETLLIQLQPAVDLLINPNPVIEGQSTTIVISITNPGNGSLRHLELFGPGNQVITLDISDEQQIYAIDDTTQLSHGGVWVVELIGGELSSSESQDNATEDSYEGVWMPDAIGGLEFPTYTATERLEVYNGMSNTFP